jgi:hypothetical protein
VSVVRTKNHRRTPPTPVRPTPGKRDPRVILDDQRVETTVQWVRTSWTKQSRGGAQATRRNAAPIAFPLPDEPPPYVHEIVMRERDDFQPHSSIQTGLPSNGDDAGVLLREADGLLRVQLTVTPFGMPRRWRRPPAVRLAIGQWVRWQINYRFSSSWGGDWTYRQDTLNLLNGPAAQADLFLGEPTRYVNELGTLR